MTWKVMHISSFWIFSANFGLKKKKKSPSNYPWDCSKFHEKDKCFHKRTWCMRYHGVLLISAKWMNYLRFLKPGLDRISKSSMVSECFRESERASSATTGRGLPYGRRKLSFLKLPFISKNKDPEEENSNVLSISTAFS